MNVTVYRAVAELNKADSIVPEVKPEELAPVDLQQLLQGKDNQLEAAIKVLKK